MDHDKVIVVTDDNFQDFVESDVPVLVDFWADWCGPCRMLSPVMDEIAKESSGKYLICKLNIDDNPKVYTKFSVRSIPTLIIFKDGKEVDRIIGSIPKKNILAKIQEHI